MDTFVPRLFAILLDKVGVSIAHDNLIAEAERIKAEVEAAYTTTALPREPNRQAIDKLVAECVESML